MAYIGVSPSNGVRKKHTYTATASQTSFSGAGDEGITLAYRDSNYVDVYQNGVKLADEDYTATSGTAIVLAQGASADDIVEIIAFDVFSVADTVSKADGGTFDGNVTMAGTLGVTGETTLQTHLNMGDGDIIKLGADADLQIYHDGSNSYIDDTGTGNLFIKASNNLILESATGENYLAGVANGSVTLYHDANAKLATASDGVNVTGDVDVSVDLNLGGNLVYTGSAQIQSTAQTGNVILSGGNNSNNGANITAYGPSHASLANVTRFRVNATESMRIHSNGVLSASAGIALGVGTANTASNVLDDYEEGSFTPAPSSGAIANKTGKYIKVGNLVHITMELSNFSGGQSSANFQVGGIPFTNNGDESVGSNYVDNVNTGTGFPNITTYVYPNNTIFRLFEQGDDNAHNVMTYNAFDTSSKVVVSFTYEIA